MVSHRLQKPAVGQDVTVSTRTDAMGAWNQVKCSDLMAQSEPIESAKQLQLYPIKFAEAAQPYNGCVFAH
ncbi:hypothetical protein DTO96_101091 [Ephemeroptericola cinctiostellae]|uniref:Uncharacterized protein n=1 Tax=Ephemeroptericola cinctiostellae TaxID=2268024 RepID=A0A345DAH3_9BURK|nr:hypothetical protein DTO96_101091 [Ephemeroptericola cinctiostellae]